MAALLCLISLTRMARAGDAFYANIGARLARQGLPVAASAAGASEEGTLSAFKLASLSGLASSQPVQYTGLPFTQALKVQSQTAPNRTWQQFLRGPVGEPIAPGDVGLLIFSVKADSDGPRSLSAAVKGADAPYPALVSADVTPTKTWQTVYLPFQAPAGSPSKANIGFFFGGARQTLEIGGVAVYDFGRAATLPQVQAAVARLPTSVPGVGTSVAANFPFFTPWDDARPSFLDVSFLNHGPAGRYGFITVRGGHFIEGSTGQRIKFLGTNIGLDGLFPLNHEDADKLAAHMAKYGINAVRLHHEDATWAGPDDSLWDFNRPDRRHIDPAKLDKMDYLVAALEKRGIYIDLCLHVSRKFTPADGFPGGVSKIPFAFDKRVDEFDPQMIAADKAYFHVLLTHVNPYIKHSYAHDPGLLSVEINNENSLVGEYGDVPGSGLGALPGPYGTELSSLWNAWLVRKYGTTAKLAAAWKSADATAGPNLYPPSADPSQWTLEVQPGAAATIAADDGGARVDVTKVDDTNWHVQLYRKGLGLVRNGTTYTLAFQMKADKARDQSIGANLDRPGYGSIGLSGAVHLTPQWQTVSLSFMAKGAEDGHNRLPSLILGTQTGSTWLRSVVLKEGVGAYTLPAAQTLEAGTVGVEPPGRSTPRADWLSFLKQTEDGYADNMRTYLRKDLGVKPLIFCSQAGFGDLAGPYRERASDFVDDHGYWDYADVPTDAISNKPMLSVMGESDALTTMALSRVAGKPFSVTEYNHCYPNEYRAEALPEYSSFAAFQDWDAIFLFSHGGYGQRGAQEGGLDRMAFTLEASVDPAIWGFLPAAALAFRAGGMPPGADVLTLPLPAQYPAARVAAGLTTAGAWKAHGYGPSVAFARRIGLGLGAPVLQNSSGVAPTLQISIRDPRQARFVSDAPKCKAVTGYIGGQTVRFTGASIAFGHLTNRFGALTLTALDQEPLAHSARVLLTFVTRTQNTGQTYNVPRTMVTSTGSGPVLVDTATAVATLETDGPRQVRALDATGTPLATIPATFQNGVLRFAITPDTKTIWYAITKP